jgi:hypothetical protein
MPVRFSIRVGTADLIHAAPGYNRHRFSAVLDVGSSHLQVKKSIQTQVRIPVIP